MEDIEVPSYFLCPISHQTMRDPVTLPTGITYDRSSVERWLFTHNHTTCPVTTQPLTDVSADNLLVPNHTLRRLIQSWCAANASDGVVERFPTPRSPVDQAHIANLLDEAQASPQSWTESLCKLKTIISESDRNKRVVEASGFLDLLASNIKSCDEALGILVCLQISEEGIIRLMERRDEDIVESLTIVMRGSTNYQSRAYAVMLLKPLLAVAAQARVMGLREEFFQEIVRVLRDQISYQATKAALQALGVVCQWGRNRIKAVNAGAVGVLIELLIEEPEKRPVEMMLVVLDQLCGCAEGRAELVGHAAGIAVVSKKMLRVSSVATEKAVRVLHSLSQFSATKAVVQEMLQVGLVPKLCFLLQTDCQRKTREKVKEILRLHSRSWRNSPCLSPKLQASYPSP